MPYADPESFVRGGATLTTFFSDDGREDPNTNKSRPSFAHQRLLRGGGVKSEYNIIHLYFRHLRAADFVVDGDILFNTSLPFETLH